ncbi:neuronal PAS domain-containing protein 2 [Patella vulgata]|uniref:neuronal PAS domain-containing protein 2 n=1 Tax=Patella vulgata TaxID=6465 RepID=UPI00217F525F|nr:neuronal PAS domain-containing protein 2 [Patella vulgata]
MSGTKRRVLLNPPSENRDRETSDALDSSAMSGSESLASYDDFDGDSVRGSSSKRKTRNQSEKKRRDQFNLLINELSAMISSNKKKKVDKSTVLKQTISFLKNHQEISAQSQAHEITEDWKPSFLSNDEFSQLMLEALDSFVMVFDQQGKILYVSESVTSLLGYSSQELLNQSLYNILFERERVQLHALLTSHKVQTVGGGIPYFNNPSNQVTFSCHLKRGSLDPTAPFLYEYVTFTGSSHKLSPDVETTSGEEPSFYSTQEINTFCCVVQLQTAQILREVLITDDSTREFTSRLSMEWKFLYLDHRASPIIGYLPFEVLGTSGYEYYHSDDLEKITECHEQLLKAGEGSSCCYRFLTKGQQWIWIRSSYYITYNQWNSKPEFIVCNNIVVSYADVKSELCSDSGYNEDNTWVAGNQVDEQINISSSSPTCSVTSSGHLGTVDVPNVEQSTAISGETDLVQQPHSTNNNDSFPLHKLVSNQLGNLLQHYMRQQAESGKQLQIQRQIFQPTQPRSWQASASNNMSAPSTSYSTSNLMPSAQKRIADESQSSQHFSSAVRPSPRTETFFSPAQRNLHEQLLEKSDMLQLAIQRQQDELQAITQQLALSKGQQFQSQTALQGQQSQNLAVQPTGSNTVAGMLPGQQDAMLSGQQDVMLSGQQTGDVMLSGQQQGDVMLSGQQKGDAMLSRQQEANSLMSDNTDVDQFLIYPMDTQD